MAKPRATKPLPHFLMGSTIRHLLGNLYRFGGCSPSALARLARIFGTSVLMIPNRSYESFRYGRQIRQTSLHPSPVFIVGHWQSGHSPLHMLMSQDPQFGSIDVLHAMFPSSFISSDWMIRPFAKKIIRGRDRGSDSIRLNISLAQGSDLPMASMSAHSAYHWYAFPSQSDQVFEKGILLNGLSSQQINTWKKQYELLLKKTAFSTGKSRLVLRNAANTGRIPHLLTMFPKAKFIHISRNPLATLKATSERWASMCDHYSLQRFDTAELTTKSVGYYNRLMKKYLADRKQIPSENLVEVQHEQLLESPLKTLARIYQKLGLDGFEQAASTFQTHLDSNTGSLGGQHLSQCPRLDESEVMEQVAFAFDAFGYDRKVTTEHSSAVKS